MYFCNYGERARMAFILTETLKKGVYQHYKGSRYRVVGIAKHSETLEDMVVYEPLYADAIASLVVRPRPCSPKPLR